MTEYITLLGTEDVSRAGNNMVSAADTMNRAVGYLTEALIMNQRYMDDWLVRLEEILKNYKPETKSQSGSQTEVPF